MKFVDDDDDDINLQEMSYTHCAVLCSYPVPDHYSLTLEIYRNRTTSARETVCDSVNSAGDSCPPSHLDTQPYVERSLNEPCSVNSTVRSTSC